jgi:hypothetical protein
MKFNNYKKRISYLILDSEKQLCILGFGRFHDSIFYWMHNYPLMKDENRSSKRETFVRQNCLSVSDINRNADICCVGNKLITCLE